MRKIRHFSCLSWGIGLILPLAGCAGTNPSVQSFGALPGQGSYGYGQDGAPPAAAAAVLDQQLAQKGLTRSDTPGYIVQSEFSHPPARTGTVVADQANPQWRRGPAKGGGQLSHISVSVTEIATGAEVYRATAWQPTHGKADDSAALMQAALNPPAPSGQAQ